MKGEANMRTSVADLEMRSLASMTREEQLALLGERPDLLPPALSRDCLSRQPTPGLQMLAVAATLIHVVWRMDRRAAESAGIQSTGIAS
jgi:hypothetical protein